MDKIKFGVISLGCDKNRIDSELLISKISKKGVLTNNPKEADVIIVNTCGFIEKSKQESIDTILEMAQYKKYNCKVLVVTGCLTQRYGKDLEGLLPEVDVILGVNDYDKLNSSIYKILEHKQKKVICCNYSDNVINEGERILTTPKHYAYVRIAEGCNNFCTYCIIPKIRGKYRSRAMENILEEIKSLTKNGVKEIILVAQDTTRYGIDIYNKKMLPKLLQEISKIDGVKWIRILYCYPEELTKELIKEISNNEKVCKYLDIPIQHISDNVLKGMGRKSSKEEIITTIKELRKEIPNIVLRTSIIVGFPGETTKDFDELKQFIIETRLDKVGVFKYSQEEGTPAAIMKNQISEEIKQQREKELMELQQNISLNINKNKIGKTYDVIIDSKKSENYIGRSFEMTPEIDGAIYFKCDKILNIGDIIKVNIENSLEYDLMGVVCYELSE